MITEIGILFSVIISTIMLIAWHLVTKAHDRVLEDKAYEKMLRELDAEAGEQYMHIVNLGYTPLDSSTEAFQLDTISDEMEGIELDGFILGSDGEVRMKLK